MRLDVFLTEKGYFQSRSKARAAIEKGFVFIDGASVLKPAFEINGDEAITVNSTEK